MADQASGSPSLPNATPLKQQGKSQRAASAAPGQPKRNHKPRNQQAQPVPQLDGTVSDSVTNPTASYGSDRGAKQRQSVANGAPSAHNGHKPRPASLAGSMLPATPAKEQAYAGPTFHASPAPSSLPVPKFFSRSVPNVAGSTSLQARMESEKTPEKESSPEADVVSPVPPPRGAQQSPLDVFFQADKAEKEKRKSNSQMLSPELAARAVQPAIEPRNPFQQSGKSIFLREMDGDTDPMPSPKTVPHKQRPPPVERAKSSPGNLPPLVKDEEQRRASTQALKDLLFANLNGATTTRPTPSKPQSRAHANDRIVSPPQQTPSPFQQSASGPWTPAPSAEQPNHYSLHYGNRNLSPMFKAVRIETPTRPSNLRQEVGKAPNSGANGIPQPRQPPPHIDPNSFSRSYLDTQVRNSVPSQPPSIAFANGPKSPNPLSGPSASQRGVQDGSASSASPRSSAGTRDIKGMEDDLRRMLKLNVVS